MIEKRSQFVETLALLYNDIHSIKIDLDEGYEKSVKKFHEVMLKWGICHGHYNESSNIVSSNAEWCMCQQVFDAHYQAKSDWIRLGATLKCPSKELEAYGEAPEKK